MITSAPERFDIIVAGAGAAGLSVLVRMIGSGSIRGKRILLVDREPKNRNDRTWCFWEKGPGFFEPIVFHSWQELSFRSKDYTADFSISPYRYKMIRGIDFYNYCFELIAKESSITVLYGTVSDLQGSDNEARLRIDGKLFTAPFILNSIIFSEDYLQGDKDHLLQHFKGWHIETAEPVFNPGLATLMDFRVPQPTGAAFVYVMPFSEHTALVEYTLFSKAILPIGDYDHALNDYIAAHVTQGGYTITSDEFGVIPMTGHRFKPVHPRILQIGTAGGQTKASSGYTFQFIQRYAAKLASEPLRPASRASGESSARYRFYDKVLLNVLASGKLPGAQVFSRMFRRNPPERILRFLDNDSTLLEDLRVISTLPTWPFLRAAIEVS